MAETLLHMGTLGRAHGLRGEVSLDWHGQATPDAAMPFALQRGQDAPQAVRVTGLRRHQGRWLLALEGIADRTAAESLRGARLLAPREALPAPADDESYVADLPGFTVLLPDGAPLGTLNRVEYPAGQEIWVITVTVDAGERELLFPAQPCFIRAFDHAARSVTIDPPEGLLDIYLA